MASGNRLVVTKDFSPSLTRVSHGPDSDGLFIRKNKPKTSRAVSTPKAVQTTPLDLHIGSERSADIMYYQQYVLFCASFSFTDLKA
jgi:hypothetical protein